MGFFPIRTPLAALLLHCKYFSSYFPKDNHPIFPEMSTLSVPDQYRTREAPGYTSITRGFETALWTRVLVFIHGHLATTAFKYKVGYCYVSIEKDISYRSVPQMILLHAPLGGEGPRSPEVIFGPHHWFLNEILLASGIFSHSIASSGPHTTLPVLLLIFSE